MSDSGGLRLSFRVPGALLIRLSASDFLQVAFSFIKPLLARLPFRGSRASSFTRSGLSLSHRQRTDRSDACGHAKICEGCASSSGPYRAGISILVGIASSVAAKEGRHAPQVRLTIASGLFDQTTMEHFALTSENNYAFILLLINS